MMVEKSTYSSKPWSFRELRKKGDCNEGVAKSAYSMTKNNSSCTLCPLLTCAFHSNTFLYCHLSNNDEKKPNLKSRDVPFSLSFRNFKSVRDRLIFGQLKYSSDWSDLKQFFYVTNNAASYFGATSSVPRCCLSFLFSLPFELQPLPFLLPFIPFLENVMVGFIFSSLLNVDWQFWATAIQWLRIERSVTLESIDRNYKVLKLGHKYMYGLTDSV